MGAHAQKFVAYAPGEKPGCGLKSKLLDQVATRLMKFAVSIRGIKQNIGIDDVHVLAAISQHWQVVSRLAHLLIQSVTISHINPGTTAFPSWQCICKLIHFLSGLIQQQSQPSLDQL
jgi:hypothetical protein